MTISITIEIPDEILLEAIKKSPDGNLEELVQAIQTNIGLKLKADAAKVLLEVCKQQNIPLADLISSKS